LGIQTSASTIWPPMRRWIVAKKKGFGRKRGTGHGAGSKQTQFAKGKSGNPQGRKRKSRKRTLDLYRVVTKLVPVTIDGRQMKLPFLLAHIERIKNNASKNDPKADLLLFRLYKELGFFDRKPKPVEEEDETYEFTLKIGKTRNDDLSKENDEHKDEDDEDRGPEADEADD
jgi:hypothetical protein